jgi:hypothetical protein
VVAVTVGWHVYEITGDPWSLGLIGLAEVIPFFCVAPFSGYLVDHLPRRKLGAACTVLAVNAGCWRWSPRELATDGTWPIYAAIAVGGVGRSFLGPVYNALFARALKRASSSRAAPAWAARGVPGRAGAGPGDRRSAGGRRPASRWHALAAGFAIAAALALCECRSPARPQLQRGPVLASIAEGLRFVFGHQLLLAALALDMFAVLLGGAISLAPAFIKDVLDAGPEALGILRGAPAVGSVAVAIWLSRRPLRGRCRPSCWPRWSLRACMVGFRAESQVFWLSALFPAAVGRVRRGFGGAAHHHPAAGYPGRDARPGVFGQQHLHQLVE